MKLLMITRKIDADDWLAGHAYEWAKKLSSKLLASGGSLEVVCLEKGNLGELNAQVHSLGKEAGAGRLKRFFKFIRLASQLVPRSDGVFCHQNPEYAIAIWPWAGVYRKRLVSWYTHKSVTWKSRLALKLSHKVLTASGKSFRLASPKVEVVGHGIDTSRFHPSTPLGMTPSATGAGFKNEGGGNKQIFKIITVGRISPVKNLEILVEAAGILARDSLRRDFIVEIHGDIGLPSHEAYLDKLKSLVLHKELDGIVSFKPAVAHSRIVSVYQAADIFVNLSATGSLDKALLEAMACELPIVTSNEAFSDMLAPFAGFCLAPPGDARELARKLSVLRHLQLSDRLALGAKLRRLVEEGHSLDKLCKKIIKAFR